MATRRIESVRVLEYSKGFKAGLSSAILEWLLIFLLFVNALFSYLVTKFARFCKLKIPCILCSRLDHVFGNEKPGFYRDLVCGAHKLEISSLVFCHVHDKLADVHGICEGCLFSFATEKKSNSETYRLLVGKLGVDHEFFLNKDPLRKQHMLDSTSESHCSCCNEIWKASPYTNRLPLKKSIGSELAKIDLHLPGSVGRSGFNLLDGLKKRRAHMRDRGIDPLSHVGYSELKITSDSESEVPFSDDDDASALVREANHFKEEIVTRPGQPKPSSVFTNSSLGDFQNKLIDLSSGPVPSLLVPHEQHELGEPHFLTSLASAVFVGHGLEELNWQQFEQKSRFPALSDLISLHDIPSQSITVEAGVEVSKENSNINGIGDLLQKSQTENGGVCKSDTFFIPEAGQGLKKDQVVEEPRDTTYVENVYLIESGEASIVGSVSTDITGPEWKTDQASNNPGPSTVNVVEQSDTKKLAVVNKGVQASSLVAEQYTIKDSMKVNEELKLLLSQLSSTRGSEPLANDTSPRVHGLREEFKIPDASSSIGLETLQKRISIERNESGYESLDGSTVSEIEGENLVDGMKRQIEYDRKCLNALYKELDEERNASAVAANQAMAMITRLQEEKAALHMEALQYLRMMEEQAEYDVEALQKANDLLAEREKEIQDLEADLDYYRIKYGDEEMEESLPESHDYKVANMGMDHSDLSYTENKTNGACNLQIIKTSEDNNKPEKNETVQSNNHMSITKGSFLNFEDEKLYISQCLKKLEKRLNICSENGVHTNICNGVYSRKEHELNEREEAKEHGTSVQKDSCLSRGGSPAQERSSPSAGEPQLDPQGKHYFEGADASITITPTDLVSLENEVVDLNERLETLEADREFLEHTINSLYSGSEGVKFIQEIAHHLHELRRIGIRRREKGVA
ncbi:Myosin-binding protein [Thalictrum thalictroides]|uniref:Myosin-binding protein n=1 Tax=Thalictrum thalictroides TaxID=46969 RepID=A0A7J6VRD5_THATH|nr:Myosin-binding protein [Thalictrum thalictroides]